MIKHNLRKKILPHKSNIRTQPTSIPLHIQKKNIACTFNALEATKSFGWKIEFALLEIIEN